MHYIGMLAYQPSGASLLRLADGLVVSAGGHPRIGVALFVVSRNEMGPLRIGVGGVFMGSESRPCTISAWKRCVYPQCATIPPASWILSVLLAIVISLVALSAGVPVAAKINAPELAKAAQRDRYGSFAIPVMHYTGMAAATFTFDRVHART